MIAIGILSGLGLVMKEKQQATLVCAIYIALFAVTVYKEYESHLASGRVFPRSKV
jgi:hypothetical protein